MSAATLTSDVLMPSLTDGMESGTIIAWLVQDGVRLSDETLDRIDEIVAPGTNVGAPDQSAYLPPALQRPSVRRRPVEERAAA